jgi:hypothetical protein
VVASKEICLEVNADKSKHMTTYRDQNAGRSHNIKMDDNNSFEQVEKFKYLRKTLTHHNSIQEKIKRRLKSGNACYESVQNLLSSISRSRNIKIPMYKIIILPVVLHGCGTWSFTLKEERRLWFSRIGC